MMKQADETKTLPVNSLDAAVIEEAAETTSPVSESPSPNDKLFFSRDETISALELQKKNPGIFSIRLVGKGEAHNLISQYERMFHQFDENGDGKISPAELRQCMEAIGEKLSAKGAEVVVETLDKDGDGLLGFDDFVMFVEELMNEKDKMYEMDDFILSHRQVADRELMEKIPRMDGMVDDWQYENLVWRDDDMANRRTNRLPTISQKNLKKAKLEQKALKRILRGSVLNIKEKNGDGQLGNSSHGRNEEDRVNNELRNEMYGTGCITPEISFSGKDNFVDPKVFDPLISAEKLETRYKKLHAICSNILAVVFSLLWENRGTTNNLLPVSSNDLANAPLGQKALCFKAFLMSVLNMPGQQRAIILTVFFGMLRTLTENSVSTPLFEFQGGMTTNTPQSVLSFSEAIFNFSPEIAYISLFIIAYIMAWPLILKLQPGLLIPLAVLMIYAPFLLFPHLLRNASAMGVHVTCSGFNLPVIGFTAVATVGFCLFFILVVFLVLYIIWRFLYRRTPARGQEREGTDALMAGIGIE